MNPICLIKVEMSAKQVEYLVNDGKSTVVIVRDWLSPEEHKDIIEELAAISFIQHYTRIPFKAGLHPSPRLNYACGDPEVKVHRYTGSEIKVNPWPSVGEKKSCHRRIRDRVEKELFKLPSDSPHLFNSCLDNWYRDGNDSISPHSDKEAENGVFTVSLGASRTFNLIPIASGGKITTKLNNGDLAIMMGETQKHYKHEIPKEKRVKDPRISLTYRKVAV